MLSGANVSGGPLLGPAAGAFIFCPAVYKRARKDVSRSLCAFKTRIGARPEKRSAPHFAGEGRFRGLGGDDEKGVGNC